MSTWDDAAVDWDDAAVDWDAGDAVTVVSHAEPFESGSEAADLTTSNTVFSAISKGASSTAKFKAAQALHGSSGAELVAAANETVTCDRTITSSPLVWSRVYSKGLPSLTMSAGSFTLIRARLGATTYAQVKVKSNGSFELVKENNTLVAASATLITAGKAFRVSLGIDASGTALTCKIYVGANLESTTPTETLGGTAGTYGGGNIDLFLFGVGTAQTGGLTVPLDSVEISNVAEPGPLGTAGAAAPAGNVFFEDFEDGPVGANLSPATTNYTQATFNSASGAFSDTWAYDGSLSGRIVTTADGGTGTLDQILTAAVSKRVMARRFRVPVLPGAPNNICTLIRVRSGATTVAQVMVDSSGRIVLRREGNTTVDQTAPNWVVPNSDFGVMMVVDGPSATVKASLWVSGRNMETTAPDLVLTGQYAGGSFDRILDGIGTAQPAGWALHLDRAFDLNDEPALPTAAGMTKYVRSAGAWAAATRYWRSAGAWV